MPAIGVYRSDQAGPSGLDKLSTDSLRGPERLAARTQARYPECFCTLSSSRSARDAVSTRGWCALGVVAAAHVALHCARRNT